MGIAFTRDLEETAQHLPEFYEVVDGQIVEVPGMGSCECILANDLKELIDLAFLTGKLGRVVIEVLFDLAPLSRKRRPDLAFVSFERWPLAKKIPRREAWSVVPNLACEVVSPSNRADEVDQKLLEYFAAGVQLAWVIYPMTERIYVYESPDRIRILKRGDLLDGGNVLPGFSILVDRTFDGTTA